MERELRGSRGVYHNLYNMLKILEQLKIFDYPASAKENMKIVGLLFKHTFDDDFICSKAKENGSIWDQAWERLLALNTNMLIKETPTHIYLTEAGEEFIDAKDKKYFLYRNAVIARIRKIKNPKLFHYSIKEFITLPEPHRRAISLVLRTGYELPFDISGKNDHLYDLYGKFIKKLKVQYGKDAENAFRNGFYFRNYGSIKIIKIPVTILHQIIKDKYYLEKVRRYI